MGVFVPIWLVLPMRESTFPMRESTNLGVFDFVISPYSNGGGVHIWVGLKLVE